MEAEDFLTQDKLDKLQEGIDDNNGIVDYKEIELLMEEYHKSKFELIEYNKLKKDYDELHRYKEELFELACKSCKGLANDELFELVEKYKDA